MASERREAALTEPPQKRVRRDDSAPGGSMSGATPTAAISHSTPLRDVEMSSATEESIKFMASKLQNLPEARLPTDYPRTAYRKDQQMVDAEKSLSLHEDTCMSLLRFSLMANVKPFTIVLAAFACLIRKFTHEEDVVVGSSSSSSNPLALRVDLGDTVEGRENPRTLWELVQHVQAVEAEAEQHEVCVMLVKMASTNSYVLFHLTVILSHFFQFRFHSTSWWLNFARTVLIQNLWYPSSKCVSSMRVM